MACVTLFKCPFHGHSHTSRVGISDKKIKKRDGVVACSGKTFLPSSIKVRQFSGLLGSNKRTSNTNIQVFS
jgi:hypothetical protein